MKKNRLRLAIQKSGRLHEKSVGLLSQCGIDFDRRKNHLISPCRDFPLDLLLVRDDDIPRLVDDGVCDLGIVGENVLTEEGSVSEVLRKLGFGYCRLALAVPDDGALGSVADLAGRRIATSYPTTLGAYLEGLSIAAKVVSLGGSVEAAPKLGLADAICDLVSSGATLEANGLVELETVSESEAALVRRPGDLPEVAAVALDRLLSRIDGVMRASRSKYIMMNAPAEAVDTICQILPGMETPTVIPIPTGAGGRPLVAIHAVAREQVFWETMEQLEAAGASSILVVPIEKIIA